MKEKRMTKKKAKKLAKRERNKQDRIWSTAVKEAFGNKCVICDQTKFLNAHHLVPREIKKFRHEVLNGVCLCPRHHKFSFLISPHRNPFAFLSWYEKNYPERYNGLRSLYENE